MQAITNAVFISDLHLEAQWKQTGEGQALLRFLFELQHPENPTTDLFLVGDIFDVMVGHHRVFIKRYQEIFNQIKNLIQQKGLKVHYFEGNHDLHLQGYIGQVVGCSIYRDIGYFNAGKYVVRVEHGDLMNPNDLDYLAWRQKARGPLLSFLAHALPGWFWDTIATRASKKSRAKSSRLAETEPQHIRTLIRTYALRELDHSRLGPFDLLISGHMHLEDDWSGTALSGRKVRSINLGCWQQEPHYLRVVAGHQLEVERVALKAN